MKSPSSKRKGKSESLKSTLTRAYSQLSNDQGSVTPREAMKILWELERSKNLDIKALSTRLSDLPPDRYFLSSLLTEAEVLALVSDGSSTSRQKRTSKNSSPKRSKTLGASKTRTPREESSKLSARSLHWSQASIQNPPLQDLFFEEFKLRVFEHESSIQNLLKKADLVKAFEELVTKTKVQPTPEQYKAFVTEVQQWAAKNPKKVGSGPLPKMSFVEFMGVVSTWYINNRPTHARILPVNKIVPQTYLLLILTLTQDYLTLKNYKSVKKLSQTGVDKKLVKYRKLIEQLMTDIETESGSADINALATELRDILEELELLKGDNDLKVKLFYDEATALYFEQLKRVKRATPKDTEVSTNSKISGNSKVSGDLRTGRSRRKTETARRNKSTERSARSSSNVRRTNTVRGREEEKTPGRSRRSSRSQSRIEKAQSPSPKPPNRTLKETTPRRKRNTTVEKTPKQPGPSGNTSERSSRKTRRSSRSQSRIEKAPSLQNSARETSSKQKQSEPRKEPVSSDTPKPSPVLSMNSPEQSPLITPVMTPIETPIITPDLSPAGSPSVSPARTPRQKKKKVIDDNDPVVIAKRRILEIYGIQNTLLAALLKLRKAYERKDTESITLLKTEIMGIRGQLLKFWVEDYIGTASYLGKLDLATDKPLENLCLQYVKKDYFLMSRLKHIDKSMRIEKRAGKDISELLEQQHRQRNVVAKLWFTPITQRRARKKDSPEPVSPVIIEEPRVQTPNFAETMFTEDELGELAEIILQHRKKKRVHLGTDLASPVSAGETPKSTLPPPNEFPEPEANPSKFREPSDVSPEVSAIGISMTSVNKEPAAKPIVQLSVEQPDNVGIQAVAIQPSNQPPTTQEIPEKAIEKAIEQEIEKAIEQEKKPVLSIQSTDSGISGLIVAEQKPNFQIEAVEKQQPKQVQHKSPKPNAQTADSDQPGLETMQPSQLEAPLEQKPKVQSENQVVEEKMVTLVQQPHSTTQRTDYIRSSLKVGTQESLREPQSKTESVLTIEDGLALTSPRDTVTESSQIPNPPQVAPSPLVPPIPLPKTGSLVGPQLETPWSASSIHSPHLPEPWRSQNSDVYMDPVSAEQHLMSLQRMFHVPSPYSPPPYMPSNFYAPPSPWNYWQFQDMHRRPPHYYSDSSDDSEYSPRGKRHRRHKRRKEPRTPKETTPHEKLSSQKLSQKLSSDTEEDAKKIEVELNIPLERSEYSQAEIQTKASTKTQLHSELPTELKDSQVSSSVPTSYPRLGSSSSRGMETKKSRLIIQDSPRTNVLRSTDFIEELLSPVPSNGPSKSVATLAKLDPKPAEIQSETLRQLLSLDEPAVKSESGTQTEIKKVSELKKTTHTVPTLWKDKEPSANRLKRTMTLSKQIPTSEQHSKNTDNNNPPSRPKRTLLRSLTLKQSVTNNLEEFFAKPSDKNSVSTALQHTPKATRTLDHALAQKIELCKFLLSKKLKAGDSTRKIERVLQYYIDQQNGIIPFEKPSAGLQKVDAYIEQYLQMKLSRQNESKVSNDIDEVLNLIQKQRLQLAPSSLNPDSEQFLHKAFQSYTSDLESLTLDAFLRLCTAYKLVDATSTSKSLATHSIKTIFNKFSTSLGQLDFDAFQEAFLNLADAFYDMEYDMLHSTAYSRTPPSSKLTMLIERMRKQLQKPPTPRQEHPSRKNLAQFGQVILSQRSVSMRPEFN